MKPHGSNIEAKLFCEFVSQIRACLFTLVCASSRSARAFLNLRVRIRFYMCETHNVEAQGENCTSLSTFADVPWQKKWQNSHV